MYDVQVELDEVEIQTGDTVQVEVGLDNVEVQTENSGFVDVEPNEYFLTSSGIYTGRLTGSIPIWLQNAIRQELTEGDGSLTSLVDDIRSLITVLEVGVQQNVTNIQTTNQSLSALETSVVSRLDTNEAAILNVESTKVTANEAQTVALELQKSTFGTDASAYITSLAATYADNDSAVVQNMDILLASVGGITASVEQISVASVDEGQARAKHSLVVNAQGNISGYVAESGTTSSFEILADTFKVSNGTTKLPVFTVDTVNQIIYAAADIKSSNYSWNSGNPIGFGLFRSGDLDSGNNYNFVGGSYYGSLITAGTVISTNFDGNVSGNIGTPTAGFRLSSEAAGTLTDPTIYGAYMRGGTLYGTNMLAMSITADNFLFKTTAGKNANIIVIADDNGSNQYDLYPYNSVTGGTDDRQRISSLSGIKGSVADGNTFSTYGGAYDHPPLNGYAGRMLAGSTNIGQVSFSLTQTGTYTYVGSVTVNGVTMTLSATAGQYSSVFSYWIEPDFQFQNVSGEGAISFEIYMPLYGTWQWKRLNRNRMIIYNK